MAFETVDLGRIFQTAEAIKGLKRQSATDQLQQQYLSSRIAGEAQNQQIQQSQEQRAQQDQRAQLEAREAKTRYLEAQAIESASDPISAVRQFAPELIQRFEEQNGPGSFDSLNADQIKKIATMAKQQAGAKAGIVPEKEPEDIRTLRALKGDPELLALHKQIGGSKDSPSNVQEWNFYSQLPPAKQRAYLEMKRSSAIVKEVAGVPTLINTAGAAAPQPLSTLPAEAGAAATIAGAEAGAKTAAETQTKAAADFPRIQQNTTEALGIINELKNHPGLEYITGLYSKAPIVPGTPQAAADALAQQVQGQTFLQAYQTLKGGGQITEVEGKKAEAAIARLSRAQSTNDYKGALGALESVLKLGLERAKKQGAQQTSAPPQQAPTATGPNGQKVTLQNGQWVPLGQ